MQVLTNQEFTYRQSPAEQDGYGKFKVLYGNTLVWNQLVQNGNFASTSGWSFNNCSGSASNNVCTISVTAGTKGVNFGLSSAHAVNKVVGHKYLFAFNVKVNVLKTNTLRLNLGGSVYVDIPLTANVDTRYSTIFSATETSTRLFVYPWGLSPVELTGNETVNVHDYMFIDLTAMFGSGNEPSTVEEFTSLFPLSYYSYNQGTLLSFNGNGIKTVGKNLNPWQGVNYFAVTDRTIFLKKGNYVLSTDNGNNFEGSSQVYFCLADSNGNNITSGGITSGYLSLNGSGTFYYGGYGRNNIPFTLNFDAFLSFGFNNQYPTNISSLQLEFGTSATEYEPYTSSTLSLPISTYFPTGMKSAGSVYDELTPSKAITRIGMVDMGIIRWEYNGTRFAGFIGDKANGNFNLISSAYVTTTKATVTEMGDKEIKGSESGGSIYVKDSSYTDATAFKNAMNGVYLYYELATPTETSFTTASLVTENPQGLVYPPQSKDEYPFFRSYKGGTEQLLPENGSVPATAPILADMNYSSGAIEVTTYPNPEQGGETSGDGWYLVGEEATVNATPNEHYIFNNWMLDGEIVSTDPEYTFEVKDE